MEGAQPSPTPRAGAALVDAAVRRSILQSHAASITTANLASGAIAIVFLLTLRQALTPLTQAVWLAALAITFGVRWAILAAVRRGGVDDAGEIRQLRACRAGVLLHGLVWGSATLLVGPGANSNELAILTATLAGLAAGSMTLTLYDLRAALLFTAATLLPLALRLFTTTAVVQGRSVLTAAMVSMLLLCFAAAARRVARERFDLAAARIAEAERTEGARRSEALLRLIFDHVGEGISVFDREFKLAAWNVHFIEFTGIDPALARTGTPLRDCLLHMARAGEYGAVDPEAETEIRLARLTNGIAEVSERRRPDGRTIEMRRNPTPGGGFVMVYVDTTARTQADLQLLHAGELLAQKSSQLELTLDSLSQGVLSIDASGRTNAYNRRLLELLDLPEAMMRERPTLHEVSRYQLEQGQFGPQLSRMDAPGRDGLLRYVAGDPNAIALHYQRTKLDGTVLDVQSHFAADGSLVRTYTDVTETMMAERALRESETRFRTLADGAPALIWISDAQGRATWFNQRWLEYRGRTMDEELAATWASRQHPDDYRDCNERFVEAFEHRRRFEIEFRLRRADGRWGWIADTGIPRHSPGGHFEGYICYGWEIEERKVAEAALIAARDEAERANRAKSEFLSRMSHELRTPLNAILGFGQLLESDTQAPLLPTQQARVQEMLRGGRHLLALINEVLDLARIESGALQLNLTAVDLPALVGDCLRMVGPVARERAITLVVEPAPAGPWRVLADRLRIEQVLLNLLSNAIKYNRDGGSVHIAIRREDAFVRLEVSDCGRGIGVEQQKRLFKAFERLDAEHSAIEGAGIGLALSKWLVDLMHGEIGVTSELGVGSTFWVRLAASGDDTPAPEAPPTSAPAVAPTHRRTVLYIEDNPVNQVLMEGMLALRPGIRALMADRPGAGITLAAQAQPDLVLLDIQLPGMDGFEVLRRLRSLAATRTIPVVAVSANAMPSDIDNARRAGFADYLTKPLEMARLFDLLDRMLAPRIASNAD